MVGKKTKRTAKKAAPKSLAKKTAPKKAAPKRRVAKKAAPKSVAKKAVTKKAVAKKAVTQKKQAREGAVAKRAPATKRRTSPAKSASGGTLDPSKEWSLDQLERHLPPVDPAAVAELRAALLSAQSTEQLLGIGTTFRTEDILAAAPPFAVGTLLALRKLEETPPGLAPELVPLLVQEAKELTRLDAAFEQESRDVAMNIGGRREQLKHAKSRALRARRGVVRTLLRGIVPVGSAQRARLERAGAKAATPAATAASVRSVASVLAELNDDPKVARVLARYRYTRAHVDHLESLAVEVERLGAQGAALLPPQRTDQQALDRQDGLVCVLIRAIWWALRDALDEGAPIRMPPLGGLERLVLRTREDEAEEEDVTDLDEDAPVPNAEPLEPR